MLKNKYKKGCSQVGGVRKNGVLRGIVGGSLLAGLMVVFSGCGTFLNQTSKNEPHAILNIQPAPLMRIVRVDRQRVSELVDTPLFIRVTPGEHQLVFEQTQVVKKTLPLSPIGMLAEAMRFGRG